MNVKYVGAGAAVVTVVGGLAALAHGDSAGAAGAAPSSYQRVWSDEFTASKLSSQWKVLPTGAFAGRTCAVASKKMSTVSGGKAHIGAAVDESKKKTSACPTHYLNSQIQTTRSFLYGKFEARIKFQSDRGMHAAFWMLPSTAAPVAGTSQADLPGYRGVEVDMAEYFGDAFGNPKAGIYSYVYSPQVDGSAKKIGGRAAKATTIIGSKKPSGGYHTYAVEWTPTAYIFSVDGKVTQRITEGVSHRPESVLLSMLTSDWEVPKMNNKKLPEAMTVDWVHVSQK